ncbi:hypothetical protein POM88_021063 [Heracleum sosnowskyi]|uniref:Uncharacterized protein n=1 Tax=Heracleum sosnowskyi TaxID=360622 RepID=A0AAD8MTF6_9APIA|nr:hypothetical protein POM88_021063 [Heracleum sosnowskyi]
MSMSWITNTLDSSIRSTLGEYDDAQLLSCSSIWAQLLAQDPLPSFDKAYQQVIQIEGLRVETHTFKDNHDNIMTFQVEHDARAKSKNFDGDKLCKQYNREGHDEYECFQIHGFSEWCRYRPRGGRGHGRGGTLATRGGRHGGMSSGRGHATTVRENIFGGQSGQHITQAASRENASGLAGFSANQIQQLFGHLDSTKLENSLQGPTNGDADWSG